MPFDPRDPASWSEWTQQWQDTQRAWADWWRTTTPLPPSTPSVAGEIAHVNERFQEKLAALWQAALALAPGSKLPEIVAQSANDKRFEAEAWRAQPYFSLLRQAYLLYADYLRELA